MVAVLIVGDTLLRETLVTNTMNENEDRKEKPFESNYAV
jgi:hypothetical protein